MTGLTQKQLLCQKNHLRCCHPTVPTVIVTSSVFQYIEKIMLKINGYQQMRSEPIPKALRPCVQEAVNP